ncbi:putative virion structural protein [Pseudomonas phage Phabio]|uniref:Putative virion structural protein n=1 Tax=Pseudomonas phage Phabio TaxID=2006668 RepID=A0A1Y0SZE3_9CAUD|nr:head maturation protease [Pseudomonas phage Phabio]ARV76889.1 putative virion structural protein [Pseudomonas phage Phabio]
MRFNMSSNPQIPTPPSVVTVGCTMLAGTNKKGILTPSADGYYTIVVGSYGTKNSAGMFYDEASGVSMFAPDSPLMRRLKKGVLFAEFKHPEPFQDLLLGGKVVRQPMSDPQYLGRIRQIDDNRVCAHIRSLSIIDGVNENGERVKMVVAEVKPFGPFKQVLQDSLDNPSINTYFSVRSITQDDMMRGIKYTREISTWDFVGEGGIFTANKYNSPALESFSETERVITPDVLWALQDEARKRANIGLESDSADVTELAKTLGWERKAPPRKPNWLR